MRRLRLCEISGCGRKHEAKGLCDRHYKEAGRKSGIIGPRNRDYLKTHLRTDRGRYTALRRAAKDKGLGFDITREQHAELLKKPCVYCSGPLSPTGHALDRLDNTAGYVIVNVVPCCVACNRIKNVYLSHDEMIVAMRAVLELRRSA